MTRHLTPAGRSEFTAEGQLDSPSEAFLREVAQTPAATPNVFERHLSGASPAPGRFQARRRLGAGGFGVVYEAFDHERKVNLALKSLRRVDGPSIARFKREFRSLAELTHPNLVQLYELHGAEGAWFFTMELVAGVHALPYMRPAGTGYDEPRIRATFLQLATGLAALHQAGKVHGDVKPANVLVTAAGRVVLIDFGLVRDVADEDDSTAGTPAYMAPEQAGGAPPDAAADSYAMGVMLHEALTGQLPAGGAGGRPGAAVAGLPEDLDKLCAELLAESPSRRPSAAEVTRCLTEGEPRVASEAPHAEEAVTTREWLEGAPFVGRTTLLRTLHEALAAAEAGGILSVQVSGRSGIGKSALLRRFVAEIRAEQPERLVLCGRCFAQESVPYKGVDGLLDDLCRHLRRSRHPWVEAAGPADVQSLTRLFPQLTALPGVPRLPRPSAEADALQRPRAFAALRALLTQAAPTVPVLVLDDLQWGALDSTALLLAMLDAPILLVTAHRAEEAATSPVLGAFFAAQAGGRVDVRRVEVGDLDTVEAEALSRSLLGPAACSDSAVQALVNEARGDPFLLSELSRQGDTPRQGAVGLGALIAARIARLPAPTRRLLEVVALEGQPSVRLVATHAAHGAPHASEAAGAIRTLELARLIRSRRTEAGEELLPYHDRIREVVTERIDPATRRAHHHALALALESPAALESLGVPEPERLLFHYRGAGRPAEAAGHAAEAAQRAHLALAFDHAARLYREALLLRDAGNAEQLPATVLPTGRPVDAEDRRLREGLARALAGAGRPREAALANLDAADGALPSHAQALRRRAAELLLGAGYVEEGLATLRAVLLDVAVRLPGSLLPSLLGYAWHRVRLGARGFGYVARSTITPTEALRIDACYTAAIGLFLVNPILAAESQGRHLLLALDHGDRLRVARALGLEVIVRAVRRGPAASTDALLQEARRIEADVGDPRLTGFLHLCEGYGAYASANWRLAHDGAARCEAVLSEHCPDASTEIDFARFTRANFLWLLGDVAELRRVVPRLIAEAHERGSRYLEMMLRLWMGPLIALASGRPDEARTAVAVALERWPRAPGSLLHVREIGARGRIALYEGKLDEAQAWTREGFVAVRRTGLRFALSQTAELRLLNAFIALSRGDMPTVARDCRGLARLRFRWVEVGVMVLRAGLARHAGRHEDAVNLLKHAEADCRGAGGPLYGAALARRLGRWIGGADGRVRIEAADAELRLHGIADPERLSAVLVGWDR